MLASSTSTSAMSSGMAPHEPAQAVGRVEGQDLGPVLQVDEDGMAATARKTGMTMPLPLSR